MVAEALRFASSDGGHPRYEFDKPKVAILDGGKRCEVTCTDGRVMAQITGPTLGPSDFAAKFPDPDVAMPVGDPLVSLRLDAHYLVALVTAALAVAGDGVSREFASVTVKVYGPDKPLVVEAESGDSGSAQAVTFRGLLMPLTRE